MSSNASPSVSHLTRGCLGSITAVSFVSDSRWLLVGCASTLHAYQITSGRLGAQCRVFDGQRIHAIKVDMIGPHTVVLIFGGKEFAILQLLVTPENLGFRRLWSSIRPDIIWDAKLLRCQAGICKHHADIAASDASHSFDVALGYAHDRVEVIPFTCHEAAASTLSLSPMSQSSSSQCEDRSLLYSMHLHGSCKHSLIVIGGTVFSHLLVWNATVDSSLEPRPVLHRLEGHEGVIFRVHANSDASTICSVSDDRSVRLWSWKSLGSSTKSPLDMTTLLNPSLGTYRSSAELFGHKARVWRGIISEEWPAVFSCSEDNTCRVWHRESGDVLASFSGQRGGIWSMAVDSDKRMIALGGGDGSVRLWGLDSVLRKLGSLNVQQSDDLSTTLLVQECGPSGATSSTASPVAPPQKKQKIENTDASSSSTPSGFTAPKIKLPPAEICRELLVDMEGGVPTVYFLSSFGRVVKTSLENKLDSRQLAHHSVLLHQYSHPSALVSLSLSPCKQVLVVGDQRGNLSLISTSPSTVATLFISGAHLSSVNFLHWILHDDNTLLLLTADAVNEVKLHRFSNVSGKFSLQSLLSFRLPCKARVSCASVINEAKWHQAHASSNDGSDEDDDAEEDDVAMDTSSGDSQVNGKFLVLGDSRGSVYVYFLSGGFSSSVAAVCRLMNVHDKSSVASVTVVPTYSGIKLLSTASDACVVEYALVQRAASPTSEVDGWFEKHQVTQLSEAADSAMTDSTPISFLRSWTLVKKRVHKLSHVSSIYQVFCPPLDSPSRDIIVCGFFSMDFVVWNLTQNYQIRRWNCGGDKRSWSHHLMSSARLSLEEAGFLFCYARHAESKDSSSCPSGEIVLRLQPTTLNEVESSSSAAPFVSSLGSSTHARLTTCLATIPLPRDQHLILTSSEDNSIKIYSAHLPTVPTPDQACHLLDSSLGFHSGLTCVSTIVDHPDVVRAIAVSKRHDADEWLLFSAGGRDYMHASRINININGEASATSSPSSPVGVSVESLCGTGGAVFHATGKAWQVRKEMDRDRLFKQDLRIMCLTAFPVPSHITQASPHLTAHSHCVVTGNSAGLLKFYLFDDRQAEFRLLTECADHFYTVLSVTYTSTNQDVLVFSGATDGKIMMWSVVQLLKNAFSAANRGSDLKPLYSRQMHQSGVDCLAVAVRNDRFILFSGGDDEAIASVSAQLSMDSSSVQDVVTQSWPNAHCSAIKSLAIHNTLLYSIGYDQRLRVWRVDIGARPPVQIDLIRQGECVLDCFDVTTIRNASRVEDSAYAQLVIAGQGLEVLQVSSSARQ